MERIKVDLKAKSYDIVIGQKLEHEIISFLKEKRYTNRFIVIDQHVYEMHKEKVDVIIDGFPFLVINGGEENKNFIVLEQILKSMVEAKLDRKSCLVIIGGGVIGDIGAFAASLFMRGIACVQVPTTLLSQVDSSVGGKTAINFQGVKNLVGSFYQPEAVFIDVDYLVTLDKDHIYSGLGEVVKYGFILDGEFIDHYHYHRENLLVLDPKTMIQIISQGIQFKTTIVTKDEKEDSIRKILNFGHTIGHGLEVLETFDGAHGQAVAEGMIYESILAFDRGMISRQYLDEIIQICQPLFQWKTWTDGDKEEMLRNIRLDKKNEGHKIHMILPVARGMVTIVDDVTEEEIKNSIRREA